MSQYPKGFQFHGRVPSYDHLLLQDRSSITVMVLLPLWLISISILELARCLLPCSCSTIIANTEPGRGQMFDTYQASLVSSSGEGRDAIACVGQFSPDDPIFRHNFQQRVPAFYFPLARRCFQQGVRMRTATRSRGNNAQKTNIRAEMLTAICHRDNIMSSFSSLLQWPINSLKAMTGAFNLGLTAKRIFPLNDVPKVLWIPVGSNVSVQKCRTFHCQASKPLACLRMEPTQSSQCNLASTML